MGTAREVRIEHFAPVEPDAALIRLIHRGHADQVVFAKAGDHWVQGASVPARELDRWMAELMPHVDADAYFTVNGFYGSAKARSPWVPALRTGRRSLKQLQWLTACFVDLDLYTVDREVDDAVREVRELEATQTIPPVSILVRSGRGIWLLWLLRNREEDGPLRARDMLRPAFSRIQDALAGRLQMLGPDSGSKDLCRVMRIAGSLNSKSKTRVAYSVSFDVVSGDPVSYFIDELAEFCGVEPPKPWTPRLPGSTTVAQRRGSLGPAGRVQRCIHRFWQLARLRRQHGFPIGTRHHAGWLLAFWLKRAGESRVDALAIVQRFFDENCAQRSRDGRLDPVGRKAAEEAVDGVYVSSARENKIRSQTIANWLDITPNEALALDPTGDVRWPAAARFGPVKDLPRSQREKRAVERRAVLRSILATSDRALSLGELRRALDEFGILATRETIRRDLRRG